MTAERAPPPDDATLSGEVPASAAEPGATVSIDAVVAPTSARAVSGSPAPGMLIDRYTVLERVGSGGMGDVYAAYDGKLDRKVALKLLRFRNEEYEARLLREAQAMARLSHPNVVAVYDTGLVGDRLYMAMEFVRGVTLRAWQKAETRGWRELVRVYVEAGRGLAAAHAAGLVHRDFKPANVLVSAEGHVKVTDFGIARAVDERSSERTPDKSGQRPARRIPEPIPRSDASEDSLPTSPVTSPTGSLTDPMTAEGTLVGTPGYMAPEQLACEAVDERTDQFAFAVSLYEALYGNKPFSGMSGGLQQIARATLLGQIAEPPKGVRVPAHIRRALLRGLSVERDARYPTMSAMLEDLSRDPERDRLRFMAIAAGTALLTAATALSVRAMGAQKAQVCAATASEAAEAWNPDIAKKAEQAFRETGAAQADDVWRRTREQIDGYMQRWSAMHKETCEATRVHGHQTESVMAARMTCLDQRRNEVRALAQIFAQADKDVVPRALQAAMGLTTVDACKDVTALMALEREPTEPDKREELRKLREELAILRENVGAGRYLVARETSVGLIARAKALGYAPVVAEALLLSAQAKSRSGASYDESIGEGADAALFADSGRADALRAEAATSLMAWSRDSGKNQEAEWWSRVAEGALKRMEERADLRAEWLRVSGVMLADRGRFEEAAERCGQGFQLGKTAKVSPLHLVNLERSFAEREAGVGRTREAEQHIAEAEETLVRFMGPDHPLRIRLLVARGFIANRAGDYAAALEHSRRAIALAEKVAPDYDDLATAYNNACESKGMLGDYRAALPSCQEALARDERITGKDSVWVAQDLVTTGKTLLGLHRSREALDAFARAVDIHVHTSTEHEESFALALVGAGEAELSGGRPQGAARFFERALATGTPGSRPPVVEAALAKAGFLLAKARWAEGERKADVTESAVSAERALRKLGKAAEAREIEEWLAAIAPIK